MSQVPLQKSSEADTWQIWKNTTAVHPYESTTCCIRLHSIALHVVMKLSSSQNPDGVYVRQVLNNGLL